MDVAAAKSAKPRPNMRNVGDSTERPSQACGCGGCQLSRPSVVVVVVVSPRGSVFSHPRAAATAATVTASTRHPGPGSRMGTGATAVSASALRGGGGRMGPAARFLRSTRTRTGTAAQLIRRQWTRALPFFFNRSRIAAGAPPAAPCIFLFFLLVLFFFSPTSPNCTALSGSDLTPTVSFSLTEFHSTDGWFSVFASSEVSPLGSDMHRLFGSLPPRTPAVGHSGMDE